jgi:hypothetical protein
MEKENTKRLWCRMFVCLSVASVIYIYYLVIYLTSDTRIFNFKFLYLW